MKKYCLEYQVAPADFETVDKRLRTVIADLGGTIQGSGYHLQANLREIDFTWDQHVGFIEDELLAVVEQMPQRIDLFAVIEV